MPLRTRDRRSSRSWLAGLLIASAIALGTTGEAHAQKSGPWMFNLKFGPAIGISNAPTAFALVLDANYAIAFNGNLYIGFPFQFNVARGGALIGIVPIQVQYDFAIPQVRGLYAYPRFVIGYGLGAGGGATSHHALIDIAGGIKYVLNGRWNFGFEPIDFNIFAGSVTPVFYRLLFYAGVNF